MIIIEQTVDEDYYGDIIKKKKTINTKMGW